MRNATVEAFERARESFKGAAEEAVISDEEDVMALIKELRAERGRR